MPQKRFLLFVQDLPGDTFAVARFSGEESMSRLFRFDLELVTENHRLDEAEIIGKPACLTFVDAEGRRRPRWGTVAELARLRENGRYSFYELTLMPRLWELSLRRLSEVYLGERTAPEIIEAVLQNAGFMPGIDYEFRLSADYRRRSFVCQYQESDFDFIGRWLEWEGIGYWFEHENGRDKLILSDNRRFHAPATDARPYRTAAQLDPGQDAVTGFVCRLRTVPARVVVQDYNYRKSPLDVRAEAMVNATGRGEQTLYGENVRTDAEAKKIAGIRAEELACQARTYHGEALGSAWQPGQFAKLGDHPREDFNRDYLVTEVRHEGSQSAVLLAGVDREGMGGDREIFHRCRFTAIHHDTPYRPPAATPWPRFHGTMNATVDAEGSGKYAEVNEYGQYKVQLPFDKTDKQAGRSSAWLRFATPYSGQDHGMHFPLHKGAEVLLSFIDGDPDQPIIIGTVPNSENRNMVTDENQTQNVIQTAGENRIEMEDQEGSQRVHISTPTANTFIRFGAPLPRLAGVGADAAKMPDSWLNQLGWALKPPPIPDPSGVVDSDNSDWNTIMDQAQVQIASNGDLSMNFAGYTKFTWQGTTVECSTGDSFKCTQADAYSVTVGDSNSVTQGNSTKLVEGWAKSVTDGNSDNLIHGDYNKETFGNTKTIQYGDAYSFTQGRSTATYVGDKISVAKSTDTTISATLKSELLLGAKNSFTAGLVTDAKLGANLAFVLGLETKLSGALAFNNLWGGKAEWNHVADMKKGYAVVKESLVEFTNKQFTMNDTGVNIGNTDADIGNSDLEFRNSGMFIIL